jgi:hypothetical protein
MFNAEKALRIADLTVRLEELKAQQAIVFAKMNLVKDFYTAEQQMLHANELGTLLVGQVRRGRQDLSTDQIVGCRDRHAAVSVTADADRTDPRFDAAGVLAEQEVALNAALRHAVEVGELRVVAVHALQPPEA